MKSMNESRHEDWGIIRNDGKGVEKAHMACEFCISQLVTMRGSASLEMEHQWERQHTFASMLNYLL